MSRYPRRIAHLSDIHFGRIAHQSIVDTICQDVRDAEVELVVVSGDLTQRALPKQFEQAAAMMEQFEVPVLVVPGNHDVYAWWRPLARITKPLARYQECISEELGGNYTQDDLAVLAVNSAHGRTIKGGLLTEAVQQDIQQFFSVQPASAFRVLVLHHHLAQLPGMFQHDISRNGALVLQQALDLGIDLVLCGHLHVSHIESLPDDQGRYLVVASAGTATSNRGRRSNRKQNYYNIITVSDTFFTVEERRFDASEPAFREERIHRFARAIRPQMSQS